MKKKKGIPKYEMTTALLIFHVKPWGKRKRDIHTVDIGPVSAVITKEGKIILSPMTREA